MDAGVTERLHAILCQADIIDVLLYTLSSSCAWLHYAVAQKGLCWSGKARLDSYIDYIGYLHRFYSNMNVHLCLNMEC